MADSSAMPGKAGAFVPNETVLAAGIIIGVVALGLALAWWVGHRSR